MTALKSIIKKIPHPPRYRRGATLIELSLSILILAAIGAAALALSVSLYSSNRANEASKRALFIMQSVRNGIRNNRFDKPTTDDASLVDDIEDSEIWPEDFFTTISVSGSNVRRLLSPYRTTIDVRSTLTSTPDVFLMVVNDLPEKGCFAVGMGLLSVRDSLKSLRISASASAGTEYDIAGTNKISNLDASTMGSLCTSTATNNDIRIKFR